MAGNQDTEPSSARQDDNNPGMASTALEMSNLDSSARRQGRSSDATSKSGAEHRPIAAATSAGGSDTWQAAMGNVNSPFASSASRSTPLQPDSGVDGSGNVAALSPAGPRTPAEVPSALMITLLLTSGKRSSYKIDAGYLKRRNVNVPTENPFDMSIYTLKELIWREWRQEWELRPSSPSAIRLIYLGRLLDDKSPLRDCRLNPDTTNVVHMSVRPQEMMDEEDGKTGKHGLSRDRDGRERTGGCRCVIL